MINERVSTMKFCIHVLVIVLMGLNPVYLTANYNPLRLFGLFNEQGLRGELEARREAFDPFAYVTGISEKYFKTLTHAQKQAMMHNGVLINSKTGQQWDMGSIEIASIAQLREQAVSKQTGTGCVFNVIEGYDQPWNNWFRDKVDVTALQAQVKNKDAVFQVASNFNGLEGSGAPAAGIMPYLNPSLYVQGEAAALSAMPGIIYRMYYMPHQVNGITYYGQLRQQLNLLEHFKDGLYAIPVSSGYIGSVPHLDVFAQLSDADLKELAGKVNVALHADVQVSGGLGPLKSELPIYKAVKVVDQSQKVNQIFAAALNPYQNNSQSPGYKNLAQMLLYAAYEGALKSAYVNGKKKVYLTLIGGGVFGNKLLWITRAIEHAAREFQAKGDMEINLVVYYSGSYKEQDPVAWSRFETTMSSLVQQSGGSYVQYKKDGAHYKHGNE